MTRTVLMVALAALLLGCSYGPKPDRRTDYVLYFTGISTAVDRDAAIIITRAAAAAFAAPDLDVTVAGYQDAPTTPESNQILSRIRAQTVANALVQRGVAQDRIRLLPRRALGADPSRERDRVEIRIGS